MFGCGCEECKILNDINRLSDSLSYAIMWDRKGLLVYYKYPDNDKKERAYQEGRKGGLIFKYNELLGYKALS